MATEGFGKAEAPGFRTGRAVGVRGGRPDLAGPGVLAQVRVATLAGAWFTRYLEKGA